MSKIVKGAAKAVGGALGLSGGAGEARDYAMDPAAFQELYQDALKQYQSLGRDPASMKNRAMIEEALAGNLGDLANQGAARKQQFQEDMARGFSADTQSMARARGGTGTLAQAMRMPGSMYDSQARARARGLTDLYSQGIQDLSSLQGVQSNMFGQDLNRAQGIANIQGNELSSRRGTQAGNLANQFNAQQAMYGRLGDTIKSGAQLAMMGMGGGAGGGSKLGLMAGPGGTGRAMTLRGRQEQDEMGSKF